MTRHTIAAIVLMIVTLAACGVAYQATLRADGALRANRMLSEALVNGDAMMVEYALDRKSGNLVIRINENNDNLHYFLEVCRPESGVL